MSNLTTFPHVGTIPTKGVAPSGDSFRTDREFVTARTERPDHYNEATEVHVYWHVPENPLEPPYLMVEVDDFTGMHMKVMVNERVLYNTSTDIEGYCTKCAEPTDETGSARLCASCRDIEEIEPPVTTPSRKDSTP
jgi:hypothetical protein